MTTLRGGTLGYAEIVAVKVWRLEAAVPLRQYSYMLGFFHLFVFGWLLVFLFFISLDARRSPVPLSFPDCLPEAKFITNQH